MNFVFLGLSLSSSWGNGHATTYRGLIHALHARGHEILFLERDQPWYAAHRDLVAPGYCEIDYYNDFTELTRRHAGAIRAADCVILGSYVPDGIRIGKWLSRVTTGVSAFYDIDTPVTLAKLQEGCCEYLSPELIPRFDLYLSFSGGPLLARLENEYGAQKALPLYCSADPALYLRDQKEEEWSLGYLGTYSPDRQPALEKLLLQPARDLPRHRFAVVGPQYPTRILWPQNVERNEHLDPSQHAAFYRAQRFTLNVTRTAMRRAGFSPSVRLFEAAACGVPIITDEWKGLDSFFVPGEEILVAKTNQDVERYLVEVDEGQRLQIARRARERFLRSHTPSHRAVELENWISLAGRASIPLKARALEAAV